MYPYGRSPDFSPSIQTCAPAIAPSNFSAANPTPSGTSKVPRYQPTPVHGKAPVRPEMARGSICPSCSTRAFCKSFVRWNGPAIAQSCGMSTGVQSFTSNDADSAPTTSPRWKSHPSQTGVTVSAAADAAMNAPTDTATAQLCLNRLMVLGLSHNLPKVHRESNLRECHVINGIRTIGPRSDGTYPVLRHMCHDKL